MNQTRQESLVRAAFDSRVSRAFDAADDEATRLRAEVQRLRARCAELEVAVGSRRAPPGCRRASWLGI
jgi:hypothetical protein